MSIKKLIQQYITYKHDDYKVEKKIMCAGDGAKPKWLEKRKCKACDRVYYSDYFYEFKKERLYIK